MAASSHILCRGGAWQLGGRKAKVGIPAKAHKGSEGCVRLVEVPVSTAPPQALLDGPSNVHHAPRTALHTPGIPAASRPPPLTPISSLSAAISSRVRIRWTSTPSAGNTPGQVRSRSGAGVRAGKAAQPLWHWRVDMVCTQESQTPMIGGGHWGEWQRSHLGSRCPRAWGLGAPPAPRLRHPIQPHRWALGCRPCWELQGHPQTGAMPRQSCQRNPGHWLRAAAAPPTHPLPLA